MLKDFEAQSLESSSLGPKDKDTQLLHHQRIVCSLSIQIETVSIYAKSKRRN